MSSDKPVCLLSIDVEDWFHLIDAGLDYQFRSPPGGHEIWEQLPSRVVSNTLWILDLLDQYSVKATFFILGWVAKHHPQLVREIQHRGHEIGSHGYWHKVVQVLTPQQFREDVRLSLDVLQEITGCQVLGFRASSASINDWATDILADEGLAYDSSFFPTSYHDVYGKLSDMDSQKPIERLQNGLIEVKFSSLNLLGRQVPWSGGGYFRLLPYRAFSQGIKQILAERKLFQFYIHPWELDADAPRLVNLKPIYFFRRYVSIRHTRPRFERLIQEREFIPIVRVLRDLNLLASGDPI